MKELNPQTKNEIRVCKKTWENSPGTSSRNILNEKNKHASQKLCLIKIIERINIKPFSFSPDSNMIQVTAFSVVIQL